MDSLPADQRAVLELVLRRGRSYDEIAQLLSIDRAGVRQRALAAFDAIGPKTRVAADRRALIADYLLDALPGAVAQEVRDHLGASASERAWARAIASELEGLSENPLPEIPSNGRAPATESQRRRPVRAAKAKGKVPAERRTAEVAPAAALSNGSPRERTARHPVSRMGGAVLLAIAAAVAIALVLVFVVFTGGGSHKPVHRAATHASTAGTGASSSASAPSTSTTAASGIKLLAQINLKAPNGAAKPTGVAYAVLVQGKKGIVLRAAGMAPNRKQPPNRYAVWLSNPSGSSYLLGVVKNAVAKNGQLVTGGGLPPTAGRYHQLLVTLETSGSPKKPGQVILAGTITKQL